MWECNTTVHIHVSLRLPISISTPPPFLINLMLGIIDKQYLVNKNTFKNNGKGIMTINDKLVIVKQLEETNYVIFCVFLWLS